MNIDLIKFCFINLILYCYFVSSSMNLTFLIATVYELYFWAVYKLKKYIK